MPAPQVYIAYSPRGAGLRCALVYRRAPRDVYGWFTGARNGGRIARYFLLDDFEHPSSTRFFATDDPMAGLKREYSPRSVELDPPASLDEALSHELVRMQDAFEHEWLCYRDDPAAAEEFAQYGRAELAAGDVALRYRLMNRLDHGGATWTFYSPGCEASVVGYLLRHSPLDYRGA